jgi:O-6-methylguanine DNA methyltransferase
MSLISHTYSTPIGAMRAVFSARGLCLLEFVGQKGIARELAQVEAARAADPVPPDGAWIERLGAQLQRYFSGQLRQFDIPLDLVGTPFQQSVWHALQQIPYGKTWSYAEEAAFIGRPTAVRAVAAANGNNKVSLVVPCHRVIGSNGKLTGYGGGLGNKETLLALEGRQAALY